jgi:hypothetical protein
MQRANRSLGRVRESRVDDASRLKRRHRKEHALKKAPTLRVQSIRSLKAIDRTEGLKVHSSQDATLRPVVDYQLTAWRLISGIGHQQAASSYLTVSDVRVTIRLVIKRACTSRKAAAQIFTTFPWVPCDNPSHQGLTSTDIPYQIPGHTKPHVGHRSHKITTQSSSTL